MRRILIDNARRKLAQRHGGDFERVDLEGQDLAAPAAGQELLAVHEVLDKHCDGTSAQAEVVKLRYFARNDEQKKRPEVFGRFGCHGEKRPGQRLRAPCSCLHAINNSSLNIWPRPALS